MLQSLYKTVGQFFKPARRVPIVRQLSATECGVAALTMVAKYHDPSVRGSEVRERLGASRRGTNAVDLFRAARAFGLRGRGVKVDRDELWALPVATILFWQFKHFVVFERVARRGVDLVDPALGRRQVPFEEFFANFTGVALVFEPDNAPLRPRGLEPNAATEVSRSVWRTLVEALKGTHLLPRVVLTSLLVQGLYSLAAFMLAVIVDSVIPSRNVDLLVALSWSFIASQILAVCSGFVRSQALVYLRASVEVNLTTRFVNHLLRLPYSFYQRHTSGDLLQRLRSNNAIRDIITSTTLTALLDAPTALTYLVLLSLLSLRLTVLVLPVAAARVTLLILVRSRQKNLVNDKLDNGAITQTFDFEMVSSIETIKAMGLEDVVEGTWSGHFSEGVHIGIAQGTLDTVFSTVLDAIGLISTLLLTFYASLLCIRGELSLGTMLAASALATGFLTPLNKFVWTALQIHSLEVYLERIEDVISTKREANVGAASGEAGDVGAIACEDVSFAYDAAGPLVLKNVSLEVDPGEMIAIVGPTGSGKSTLARLLAGLYVPTEGRIRLNGRDLASSDVTAIRHRLGIVTQDTQLFSGSVRQNITLAKPSATLADIVHAAKLACLHNEVQQWPMGYDTVLADRGLSLSGGQRQRVAIARAIVRKPSVLIFDEATSHLDAVTESEIATNLTDLRCTRIIIAHRLNSVRYADRILVMQAGRIVEHGRHDELLQRGSAYARLFAHQLDRASSYPAEVN